MNRFLFLFSVVFALLLIAPGASSSTSTLPDGYIAIGDSITRGSGSNNPRTDAWPVLLDIEYIGRPGMALTTDETPAPWLALLDTIEEDLNSFSGPSHLIVEIGTNDLRFQTVYELIRGYKSLNEIVSSRDIHLTLTTVPPRSVFRDNNGRAGLPKIRMVNNWIRSSGIDYIDLDPCLGTPNTRYPRLRPSYDSGDGVHPSTRGYRRMANCISAHNY